MTKKFKLHLFKTAGICIISKKQWIFKAFYKTILSIQCGLESHTHHPNVFKIVQKFSVCAIDVGWRAYL